MHLFWGDKPTVIADKVREMRTLAAEYGRENAINFGIRLQVIFAAQLCALPSAHAIAEPMD